MMEPSQKYVEVDGVNLVVDWLMYRSYEFNRERSPFIHPDRWRKIYYNAEMYEKIYQQKGKTHERSH